MSKKLLSFILINLFFVFQVSGQKNISFLGNVKFPGKTLAGVWHYVSSTNKEYALVGTGTGLSIVDVTTPTAPNLLFDIPGVNSLWREVKTYSHYAYVTTEGVGGGITIIDMDSLPLAVNYKTYTGDGAIAGMLGRSHTLQIEGNYLYINGATGLANGGVLICDLTDPWNPVYVGEENLRYCHDSYIRNDTLWASELNNGFSVFDITNKTNPVFIVSHNTPSNFNHNAWLSDNGKYLFTTDEKADAPLGVFDVSDLTNIQQVDLYYTTLNPSAEVHNVRVINDYLINPSYGNSSYGAQLTIVDAARPSNVI